MPFGCVRGCWRWRLGCSAVDALEREDRVSNPHLGLKPIGMSLRGMGASRGFNPVVRIDSFGSSREH